MGSASMLSDSGLPSKVLSLNACYYRCLYVDALIKFG